LAAGQPKQLLERGKRDLRGAVIDRSPELLQLRKARFLTIVLKVNVDPAQEVPKRCAPFLHARHPRSVPAGRTSHERLLTLLS
jgi:hypothetical protein